ncbi:30S ribosomal protein S16 [candidate division WWE3 bacterium]|jgi:small subunit ribosomal protein S16|nr:30S ribosomal protein S16 [candidate division WWE3 bacterium]MBT7349217.1 30S ribosomal protein S16 [candidate division WWE3 bacterium]
MSVTIRLARIGKRNAPAYKVVVANTRDKRNGRFLEVLGHYNPSNNPVLLEIDTKKVDEWKGKGAMISDAVTKLIDGTYEYQPYTRQNEDKGDKEEESSETTEGTEKASEEASEEPAQAEIKDGEPAETPEKPKE